jgi:hypothetical protein
MASTIITNASAAPARFNIALVYHSRRRSEMDNNQRPQTEEEPIAPPGGPAPPPPKPKPPEPPKE